MRYLSKAIFLIGFSVMLFGCMERTRYLKVRESEISASKALSIIDVVGEPKSTLVMNTCSMAYSYDSYAIVTATSQTPMTPIDCAKDGKDIPYGGSFSHVTFKILHPLSADFEMLNTIEVVALGDDALRDWPQESELLVGLRQSGGEWFLRSSLPVEVSRRETNDIELDTNGVFVQLPSSIETLTNELRMNEIEITSTCYPDPASYPYERIDDEGFFEMTKTNDCHTYDPTIGTSPSEPLPGDDTYPANP